ncbi:MAG: PQQ-dependent sugar dehydrogenase [Elusimicrobia bacterium]|nr:PQQ-dependent sugar dehydrogenase [Elusimicrobiota bacterium]
MLLLAPLLAVSLASAAPRPAFKVEILARRADVVWGFDFLPDGRIILTERKGRLGVYDPKTKEVSAVAGAPAVWGRGQGGLLDVRVHPDFAKNHWIYLTWSQPVEGGAATALGRGRLEGGKLEGFERLFLSNAGGGTGEHFGSRIEFDGPRLYVSLGERGHRDLAQDLRRHNGKIVRLAHDGKPDGANLPGALPDVWSWGHRNPQGLAVRPGTKQLWSSEMGPRGGDELNLVKRGVNYGWPVITYGREYHGPRIGPAAKEGMAQPAAYWVPSISPSAMAFYDGTAFPEWKGSVFLACLSGERLRRVALEGDAAGEQEDVLADRGWRFRNVRQGPDGLLYFSTDEGLLGRLAPVR